MLHFFVYFPQANGVPDLSEAESLLTMFTTLIQDEKLNESQLKSLLDVIKNIMTVWFKKLQEANKRAKEATKNCGSSSSQKDSAPTESCEEKQPSSKEILNYIKFLTITFRFLEATCESTSELLCSKTKGNYSFSTRTDNI